MFYQCAETLVCHDQYLVKEATFVYIVCVLCVCMHNINVSLIYCIQC